MKRSLATLLTGLAVFLFGGCALGGADKEDEGSPPSAETLDELREFSENHYPIYWLGDSFRGRGLSGAEFSDEEAYLSYGMRSCSPGSGCTAWPITVSTFGGGQDHFLPPAKRSQVCFEHVRGGLLIMDCRNARHPATQSGELYTGGQFRGVGLSISGYMPGLTIGELARALVPIEDASATPRRLPPPHAIPCESLEFLVRWWVKMVSEELGTIPSSCPNR